jgi:hypothetical protein
VTGALLDVPAFTTSATRDGFDCFVPLLAIGVDMSQVGSGTILEAAQAAPWGLTWMGIEP